MNKANQLMYKNIKNSLKFLTHIPLKLTTNTNKIFTAISPKCLYIINIRERKRNVFITKVYQVRIISVDKRIPTNLLFKKLRK